MVVSEQIRLFVKFKRVRYCQSFTLDNLIEKGKFFAYFLQNCCKNVALELL
jgi:hypothetical protein